MVKDFTERLSLLATLEQIQKRNPLSVPFVIREFLTKVLLLAIYVHTVEKSLLNVICVIIDFVVDIS